MIVSLLPPDIEKCREVALRRVAERTQAGALNPKDHKRNFKKHFSGALGEYALCKYFECEWSGKYFEGSDWDNRKWDTEIGESRATFQPDRENGMRMYPTDDRPNAPYIWVNLRRFGQKENPIAIQAKFVGWAWQSDVLKKNKEWWDSNKEYWIIPKEHLRSMDTLPTIR